MISQFARIKETVKDGKSNTYDTQTYSIIVDEPKHEDCPVGSNSWCSFQRDMPNQTNKHVPIKNPLPPAVVTEIQPIFHRLGIEHF